MTIRTPNQQAQFQPHKKGWMLNHNEHTVEVVNESGEPESWYEYDQVFIIAKTIEAIAVAIIRTKYSANAEFKMGRMSKLSTEWKDYDAFAEAAVAIAHEVLNV